jgi:hypothetical protein
MGAQVARCRAMRRAREMQRDCELKVGDLLLAMREQTMPPLAALGLHRVTAKQWQRWALKARSKSS